MTTFRNLTNEELVRALSTHSSHSPLIRMLCERIESLCEDINNLNITDHDTQCPICEAKLIVKIDKENEQYTLTV